jgi:hypothetical protein
MDRPPIGQASGGMLRRASGPTPIDQASTSSSLSEIEPPSSHAWPILRHRSSSLLSSRCRVFALQDRAIPAPQVTKITALPLTGKSLLVVFDAERAGIII